MTAAYTKIIVRNLQLDMHIGIYDYEKKAPQRVLVNVEADIRGMANWTIENTLSYEDVVNAISRIAANGHINLVETFAELIAAYCLQQPMVQAVKVGVVKPDVIKTTEAVGVEIFRIRE